MISARTMPAAAKATSKVVNWIEIRVRADCRGCECRKGRVIGVL